MGKLTTILAVMASFLLAQPAAAAVIRVEYEGIITSTFGGFPGNITVSGSYTYEEPASPPSGTNFSYQPIDMETVVGGVTLAGDFNGILVRNDLPLDSVRLRDNYVATQRALPGQLLTSDIELRAAGLSFEQDGDLLNRPRLTTSLIPPTDAAFLLSLNLPRSLVVTFTNLQTGGNFAIHGQVTELSISEVPVPASVWLFLAGVSAFRLTKRRRSRTST